MIKLPINSLLKIAELKTQLQPHQSRIVEKMRNQSGLVVAHGMGSGKTLASLAVLDDLKAPANIVTPAALKNNYKKEYDKHTLNSPAIHQEGLENIARKGGIPNPEAKKNPLLIVDEAHNIRDPSTKANAAIKKINNQSEKSLFLTGTPMYNHPSDISTLVNMAAREKLLPENKADFESKYIYNKEVKPGFIDSVFRGVKPGTVPVLNKFQKDNLQQILNKWVDYHPSSKENFPSVTEEDIKVPMTESQLALYDSILGTAPSWLAAKIKSGLPPDKKEAKELNAFATGIRQISNTTAPFIQGDKTPESPKIQRAFEELKKHLDANPQGKAVIYSNWLDAGLNPYKAMLDEAKIPYGEFTGRVDQNTRNQMVQDYNDNKLKALLLSSAGGTGLDLKATSLMQLLDPHFNASKIDQAQGRAIRFGSHAALPEEQRKVQVQRFLATRPETSIAHRLGLSKPGGAVDEYLTGLSKYKSDLSKQFEALMEEQDLPKIAHNEEALAKAEKIAKISDDVDKFLTTKNYQFLIKKLPSPKFQSSLISKIEDPSLKNFIANNGKHAIALKKNKGTHHQVESSSQPAKSYTVIDHGNSWTCNCQDYLYKKAPKNGECKHIIKAKELEKTASAYVTHFSQEKQTTCSAACAKMALDYYGIYKTEEECEKGIGVHSKGAENDQVADFLTKSGLKCINKELSPEEVKQFLDMNCPIIIDGKSFKYPGKFHYTVLSDLDTEKDVAVVFDPNYDKKIRTLTLKELDDIWHSKQMYKPHKPLVRQGIVVIGHEKMEGKDVAALGALGTGAATSGAIANLE